MRSDALSRGFVGGRGSGKSWVLCHDVLMRAQENRLYLVGSPTYDMLRDATFRTFLQLGRELDMIDAADVRLSPPSVRLKSGAEVIFRSADDPEHFRGPNLSGVALDEASLMKQSAYDIALACLREGGEQGWISAAFTPRGLGHWTYDVFGKGRPDTELFHAKTSDNPFNPPKFAATLARQYVALQARQELGGEFIDAGGVEWPGEYFHGIFVDRVPPLVTSVMALDPSKGKGAKHAKPAKGKLGDYSAFVRLGIADDGMMYVDADLARRPVSRPKGGRFGSGIVEDGLDLYDWWKPAAFVVEINQFQELLVGEFARVAAARGLQSLPLYGINNMKPAKEVRIRTLGPYLARGDFRFKNNAGTRILVQQLQDFPVAEFDDGADALEMAVKMLRYLLGGRTTEPGQPVMMRM